MPLTEFQSGIARLLSQNRSPESHLAGGAALHFSPNSKRFSNDLDYFHDSVERVAHAFEADSALLITAGYSLNTEVRQPGYIRAVVNWNQEDTKLEWAHDSAWRFMPAVSHPLTGFQLHPVDLAVNKALTLAGRDEARDFIDILFINREILSLGALCWAAVGKDPGFTPYSLLELLRRRGKYRQEDFSRLHLTEPVDLLSMKSEWLEALEQAGDFIGSRPPDQAGCLYYSTVKKSFVTPESLSPSLPGDVVVHYGRPGGVLPEFCESQALTESSELLRAVE